MKTGNPILAYCLTTSGSCHSRLLILWIAIALLVNACSGAPGVIPRTPARGSASTSSSQMPAPSSAQALATATFILTIPHTSTSLRAAYISTATRSFSIAANGGDPVVTGVTTQQTTYTVQVLVPSGQNSFVVKLYDTAGGTGNVLSKGTISANVVKLQDNPIDLTLAGVTASIQLSAGTTTPAIGVTQNISLNVVAKDAAGNQIIGPYADAITLVDGDTSSQALALNTTSVLDSSTTVTINYDGAGRTGEQFCASAPGVTQVCTTITPSLGVQSVTVSPTNPSVYIGNTTQLSDTVKLSDNSTESSVTWGSADTNKATVNQSGVVTGVAGGSVSITATSTRDTTKSGSVVLTIPTVQSVSVSPSNPLVGTCQ